MKIYLPRYKNALPHGGAELVEAFVARMVPGAEVKWAGNLERRAGVGVAYGFHPNRVEREAVWAVARNAMSMLPKRDLSKDLIPMNCKSRVITRSEAEAACEARYGVQTSAMVPTYSAAE